VQSFQTAHRRRFPISKKRKRAKAARHVPVSSRAPTAIHPHHFIDNDDLGSFRFSAEALRGPDGGRERREAKRHDVPRFESGVEMQREGD
jgi:hypothetical protein